MENYISFQNIELTYYTKTQRIPIFKDLNLTIDKGEFVCLYGPSGMGKSSLLNMVSGFVKPNSGKITIDNTEINKMHDKELCNFRNKKIGYIFQAFNLIPQFNVRQNIAVPLTIAKLDKKEIEPCIDELLERVGINNRQREYPNTLSGGEQQRVAIARAIANSPDIILADEPTGNLDKKNGQNIIQMLKELNDEGNTVIAVSHDSSLIELAEKTIDVEAISNVAN
ncbi:MAG: ABC transporter ATP-binding protein [Clostridiales bacterium]|jgi:putative ABC transport system ATP-binding protein|nr:ABC transporter ATP-binding protein [Clostridiales bacterium]